MEKYIKVSDLKKVIRYHKSGKGHISLMYYDLEVLIANAFLLEALNLENSKTQMIAEKSWSDFRNTGLVLIINQFLQVFGWSIVFEVEQDEILDVYPARTRFRGFDPKTTEENYKKVASYMRNNSADLYDDAE